jgi:hypothetical protein
VRGYRHVVSGILSMMRVIFVDYLNYYPIDWYIETREPLDSLFCDDCKIFRKIHAAGVD